MIEKIDNDRGLWNWFGLTDATEVQICSSNIHDLVHPDWLWVWSNERLYCYYLPPIIVVFPVRYKHKHTARNWIVMKINNNSSNWSGNIITVWLIAWNANHNKHWRNCVSTLNWNERRQCYYGWTVYCVVCHINHYDDTTRCPMWYGPMATISNYIVCLSLRKSER